MSHTGRRALAFSLDLVTKTTEFHTPPHGTKLSSHTSFFKTGECMDRHVVCLVDSATFASVFTIMEVVPAVTYPQSPSNFKLYQVRLIFTALHDGTASKGTIALAKGVLSSREDRFHPPFEEAYCCWSQTGNFSGHRSRVDATYGSRAIPKSISPVSEENIEVSGNLSSR